MRAVMLDASFRALKQERNNLKKSVEEARAMGDFFALRKQLGKRLGGASDNQGSRALFVMDLGAAHAQVEAVIMARIHSSQATSVGACKEEPREEEEEAEARGARPIQPIATPPWRAKPSGASLPSRNPQTSPRIAPWTGQPTPELNLRALRLVLDWWLTSG